ncbi:MAG: GyrI-like domain-containing protein [Candidatus Hodarchaeales archaeon]|jgi:effector-binding domain-containing protein
MKMNEAGITYKKIQETLVASIQTGIKSSDDILKVINKLSSSIPKKIIAGPAFGRTIWITSLPEDQGTEMEIGFPVTSDFNSGDIKSRMLPNREVLSILHTGPMNQKTETSKKLWDYVTRKGFISDEFIIEIYHDSNNPQGNKIEIQFIIHNWQELFRQHTIRVLGEEIATTITPESLEVEATLESRLDWAKKAIIKVNCHANEEEAYDILSSCAHIFPLEPIEKMRLTYEKARETLAPIASIDQVLLMMTKDRAWGKAPVRDGNVLIATKNPANREAFEKATTSAEKRRAACFCPIIRNSLDDNTIPQEYCFCSAGWFRRQWEGTLSQPVKVDTLKTVLRGDEVCQFAIQIPETLIW